MIPEESVESLELGWTVINYSRLSQSGCISLYNTFTTCQDVLGTVITRAIWWRHLFPGVVLLSVIYCFSSWNLLYHISYGLSIVSASPNACWILFIILGLLIALYTH